METEGSVTVWLGRLNAGDEREAQQHIWNRYFRRLIALARKQLGDCPRRVIDEEDIVVAALDSFFQGARAGAYPQLKDRTNLWALLSKITARKAINERYRQMAKKRGGGKVRGDSLGFIPGAESGTDFLGQFPNEEVTPSFLVMMREECRRLFEILEDPVLCDVARMKLENYTNAEIAQTLDVVERTVERKLHSKKGLRGLFSR